EGALGDPRRMLEHAAKPGDELVAAHATWAERRRPVGMRGAPVGGDLAAGRQPDAIVALHVVDEALESRGATGTAYEAAVQANSHHARPAGLAFAIERVEAVLQVGEELVAVGEPGGDGEAHVVGLERVGDDQLRRDRIAVAVMVEPVRQLVVIGVGYPVETAFGG